MSVKRLSRCAWRRPGRLTPPHAKRLRARSMHLRPGEAVAWHSTGSREELLIALAGRLRLERRQSGRLLKTVSLVAGQCAFLPRRVIHRMVNHSPQSARYLYVTG